MSTIATDSVVTFHYQLHDGAGQLVEDSRSGEPLPYLHGHRNILPGLEQAMEGHRAGESFSVKLSPQLAYGLRDEGKIITMPRSQFAGFDALEAGMAFQFENEAGEMELGVIAEIDGEDVTVDANHPLAGHTLTYEVEVVAVRQATAEELKQGRPAA